MDPADTQRILSEPGRGCRPTWAVHPPRPRESWRRFGDHIAFHAKLPGHLFQGDPCRLPSPVLCRLLPGRLAPRWCAIQCWLAASVQSRRTASIPGSRPASVLERRPAPVPGRRVPARCPAASAPFRQLRATVLSPPSLQAISGPSPVPRARNRRLCAQVHVHSAEVGSAVCPNLSLPVDHPSPVQIKDGSPTRTFTVLEGLRMSVPGPSGKQSRLAVAGSLVIPLWIAT